LKKTREKLPRLISTEEINELKSATRRDLRLAIATSFALITRPDESQLSDYGRTADPSTMPIDVLVDLVRDTGSYDLVDTLCRLLNGKFVPDTDGTEPDIAFEDVGNMMREGGEANSAVLSVLHDGGADCVTRIGKARQEVREAMNANRRVYQKLAAREIQLRKAVS
jgi:hypothetical protein